eukprot:TRINITY_DN29_c0_g1_i1.p2 TRINITY_DN29_c0_g1~~TRINITY_DN29_c0_g1_i1.p2  ORF type:complete len:228 (-),score=93.77 TRINITY_DN29_c0_g1_i1:97-696(-)
MDTDSLVALAVSVPIILATQFVDWDRQPVLLWSLRLITVAVTIAVTAATYAVYSKIKKHADDSTKITAPVNSLFGKSNKTETLSIKAYDIREWKNLALSVGVLAFCAFFLHFQSHIISILAIQAVVGPYLLYSSKLFQIYILGYTGSDYTRPFKVDDPFAQIMDQVKEMSGQAGGRKRKIVKKPSERTLAKIRAEQRSL